MGNDDRSCSNTGDRKKRKFQSSSKCNMLFLLAPTRTAMAAAGLREVILQARMENIGLLTQSSVSPLQKKKKKNLPLCTKTVSS